MPQAMYKEHLNHAQCERPACKHADHSVLFLNARCHTRGNMVYPHAGCVQIVCAICQEDICLIAVTDILPSHQLIRTPCHHAIVEVAYHLLEGKLHLNCNQCKKEFMVLTVASSENR